MGKFDCSPGNQNAKGPHKGLKKRQAQCRASQQTAVANRNRKSIRSLDYIMQYMPPPVFGGRAIGPAQFEWPKVVALTGGRALSRAELEVLTSRLITVSGNRDVGVHDFAKKLKPFLPESITFNLNWFDWEDRYKDSGELWDKICEFKAWSLEYMGEIEAELARFYLAAGHKAGEAYLRVLERRFRSNWNINAASFKAAASVSKDGGDEAPVASTVTFNFEIVGGADASSE